MKEKLPFILCFIFAVLATLVTLFSIVCFITFERTDATLREIRGYAKGRTGYYSYIVDDERYTKAESYSKGKKVAQNIKVYYHKNYPQKAFTKKDFTSYYYLTFIFDLPIYLYFRQKRRHAKESYEL